MAALRGSLKHSYSLRVRSGSIGPGLSLCAERAEVDLSLPRLSCLTNLPAALILALACGFSAAESLSSYLNLISTQPLPI